MLKRYTRLLDEKYKAFISLFLTMATLSIIAICNFDEYVPLTLIMTFVGFAFSAYDLIVIKVLTILIPFGPMWRTLKLLHKEDYYEVVALYECAVLSLIGATLTIPSIIIIISYLV